MRLTVLGNCGSFPGPDGACSGYLLEEGGLRVLLDCGSGVISRLQRYCRVEELDAIVASHLHLDHVADLLVLQYGLHSKRALGQALPPLPLYMPPTPEDVVRLLDPWEVFTRWPVEDGMLVQIGPLALSFTRMEHSVESYAVTVRAQGVTLVYSGDTVLNPRLVEAAAGADLLLCESTALEGQLPSGQELPHMSARQAAEVARQAGVRRLLLTHLWYELPREEYLAEARRVFPNADLAEEFLTYDVA